MSLLPGRKSPKWKHKRSTYWKKLPLFFKRISLFKVHNWTGYVALSLIFLHPLILLLDASTKYNLAAIFLPFKAPQQQIWVTMGILSMYCIALVVLTSQKFIRKKTGFRTWKNIHLLSYLAIVLFCLHGVFMDQELKNRDPDFFDAEKLLSELCLLVLLVASVVRYRQFLKNKKAPSRNKGR